MRISRFLVVAALLIILGGWVGSTSAREGVLRARRGDPAWHGYHYDPAWGMPLALVVPPNAENQVHYGWGVGNTRVTRINSQFSGEPQFPFYDPRGFRPTPRWPTDTDQFGVYYVRGPW